MYIYKAIKNLLYMCKRKDQNLKHHICLFVKRQIFVSYITSS